MNNPRLGPHTSQLAYQRNDMQPPTMADLYGGGGCPMSNDVLVPDLPFDFLQPQMRKQVTQQGYGGPFLIRSNPIGAIVDAVRGFCFPTPMEQTSADGSTYSGEPGLGSYGDYSSPMFGADGYSGVGFAGGGTPPMAQMTCMSGAMWDYNSQMCVPTPGSGMVPDPNAGMPMDPCGAIANADQAAKIPAALAKAANKDYADLCAISVHARQCEMISPQPLKAMWRAQADSTKAMLAAAGCSNCSTCVKTPPAPPPMGGGASMTPEGMPMGTGMPTPMAGGSPGTNNSGMNDGMGMEIVTRPGEVQTDVVPKPKPTGPFGYISLADSLKDLAKSVLSPGTGQNVAGNITMPSMPAMPDPASLTEGNIFMRSSPEPLQGSFDPQRIAYHSGNSSLTERARGNTQAFVGNARRAVARRGL